MIAIIKALKAEQAKLMIGKLDIKEMPKDIFREIVGVSDYTQSKSVRGINHLGAVIERINMEFRDRDDKDIIRMVNRMIKNTKESDLSDTITLDTYSDLLLLLFEKFQ